jgi:hypothetical protein
MNGIDVHQHLWPEPFVAVLHARRRPPRLRGWTLELADAPDYLVRPVDHDPGRRRAQAVADGVDLVLLSLSSPLGIEQLPARECNLLLDTYHESVMALGPPFAAWASMCLAELDVRRLERELERGCVGLQLPATALLDARGYAAAASVLDALESADRPLFIHPGPAGSLRGSPEWWPAIVPYVQQMHAAWYAFQAYGRPRHPDLRVCFAMLAGLAPLHGERVAARGGPRGSVDEHAFLDTSSYGPRAVDATIRVLGVDVLVNGSDRPYAAPDADPAADAVSFALRSANPRRLLEPKEVSDDLVLAARA